MRRCKVLCECGKEKEVFWGNLQSGQTKSCGCRGTSLGGVSRTKIHQRWRNMLQRCTNPDNVSYPHYGGRGIKVCERWMEFENFHADMGEIPEGKFLDRIDNDGDYCPENCHWVDFKQQCRNRRSNRILEMDGKSMPVTEWAEKLGISRQLIYKRLQKGWPVERALSKPRA